MSHPKEERRQPPTVPKNLEDGRDGIDGIDDSERYPQRKIETAPISGTPKCRILSIAL
jgi:hypothetical protein